MLSFPPQDTVLTVKPPLHCLIFFVPGNPGLIEYYEPFLSALRWRLDTSSDGGGVSFHLVGVSLIGFHDVDHEPFTPEDPPFDLDAQIRVTYERVAAMRIAHGPRRGEPYDTVLLMGRMSFCLPPSRLSSPAD